MDDWLEDAGDADELPPRPRRRLLGAGGNPIVLALLAALLVAGGFIGGVEVQKGEEGTTAASGGAGSGLASRFAGCPAPAPARARARAQLREKPPPAAPAAASRAPGPVRGPPDHGHRRVRRRQHAVRDQRRRQHRQGQHLGGHEREQDRQIEAHEHLPRGNGDDHRRHRLRRRRERRIDQRRYGGGRPGCAVRRTRESRHRHRHWHRQRDRHGHRRRRRSGAVRLGLDQTNTIKGTETTHASTSRHKPHAPPPHPRTAGPRGSRRLRCAGGVRRLREQLDEHQVDQREHAVDEHAGSRNRRGIEPLHGAQIVPAKQGITLPAPSAGNRPAGGRGGGGGRRRWIPAAGGSEPTQYQEALKKCGGGKRTPSSARFDSAAGKAALTKYVACMRENGVKLPTPNTSGKGPVFDTNGSRHTERDLRLCAGQVPERSAAVRRRGAQRRTAPTPAADRPPGEGSVAA